MYEIDNENRVIDIHTGEIIDLELIKQAKEHKIIDDYNQMQKELINLDIKSDLVFIKYKGEKHKCVSIKYGYTFGKVFRVALRDLMKNCDLSKNALATIALLEPFIYFPTNTVVINESSPTLKDLEGILKLKKSALYNTLNELESYEIIKKIKKNGNIVIYFNPFLYCGGAFVTKDTYDLFKDSKYNSTIED